MATRKVDIALAVIVLVCFALSKRYYRGEFVMLTKMRVIFEECVVCCDDDVSNTIDQSCRKSTSMR